MAATIWGDQKDTSTMSSTEASICLMNHQLNGGDICDNCYDDDTGKALLDMCCKKSVDCGELATQWAIGVALAVIGFILALIATCGVCMCCCFGKEGAPSVALSGSPPVAIKARSVSCVTELWTWCSPSVAPTAP